MATMMLKDEYTGEMTLTPRPTWEELAAAFRRVEREREEVDDLKEAKERLTEAEGALAALGRRVRGER